MSAAKLGELVTVLEQGAQGAWQPAALLERALPALKTALPEAASLRAYLLRDGLLHLHGSTDTAASTPLQPGGIYGAALQTRALKVEGTRVIVPLVTAEQSLGCLEVHLKAAGSVPEERLQLLGLVLALALLRAADLNADPPESSLQAQYEATSAVYVSSTLADMLAALYRFSGGSFARGQLILKPDSAASNWRILAEVDAINARPADKPISPDEIPAFESLTSLESLIVEDVSTANQLNSAEKIRLAARNIGALVLVPLMVSSRLIGMVYLHNPTPRQIAPDRQRALRGVADQLAIKLENRQLLANTQTSLYEMRTLYETNRALLNAQDMLDVLRALRDHLAPSAVSVAHMQVEREGERRGSVSDLRLRHRISGSEEQVLDMSLKGGMIDEALPRLNALFNDPDFQITFVEDAQTDPISRLFKPYFQQQGIRSSISLMIHESGRVQEVIAINFDAVQAISETTRRLYTAIRDQVTVVLQIQRLLADTQTSAAQLGNQVRVLQAINQLGAVLTTRVDETALLAESCQTLVAALNIQHCAAMILNEAGTSARVVSEYPDYGFKDAQFDLTTPDQQRIRQLRQPTVLEDFENASLLSAENRAALRRINARTVLLLPLVDIRDTFIGALALSTQYADRSFSADVIEMAQTMGTQIAIGLQNVRLLHDAQRRAEQLQHIATFSQSVQATLDLETIIQVAIRECVRMIPLDVMTIALYDKTRAEMRVVGQYVDDSTVTNVTTPPTIEISGTTIGEVWRTRQFMHLPEMGDTSPLRHGYRIPVKSLMTAPIFLRGIMRGTVEVAAKAAHLYKPTDSTVFQQMVSQFAVALENAEAFTQSQRLAQNKVLANEISTQLQRQASIDAMLNITVIELGKALGAKKARIRLGTNTPDKQE